MTYYVYVLLCENGSYYTGFTTDVELRFKQHQRGLGARYTRIHRPIRIVHVEKFGSRSEAVSREKAIKRLSHQRKKRLVAACDI